MKKIIVEWSNERLITPSGLSLVGGALGKSDLVKRANRVKIDNKRSQPQIKNTYLADINEQATEQVLLLTKQIAEREGVTEQLKAQDQMLWVQHMNNIRDRVTEIINHELIYA